MLLATALDIKSDDHHKIASLKQYKHRILPSFHCLTREYDIIALCLRGHRLPIVKMGRHARYGYNEEFMEEKNIKKAALKKIQIGGCLVQMVFLVRKSQSCRLTSVTFTA